MLDDGHVRQFVLLDTGFADSGVLAAVRTLTDAPPRALLAHGTPTTPGPGELRRDPAPRKELASGSCRYKAPPAARGGWVPLRGLGAAGAGDPRPHLRRGALRGLPLAGAVRRGLGTGGQPHLPVRSPCRRTLAWGNASGL